MKLRAFVIFAPLFLIGVFGAGCDSNEASTPTETSASANDTKHITKERFEAVRKIFEDQGSRVERDPKATDTVRIYVTESVAAGLSATDAQKMAKDARERLAEEAIVYVKNPNGDTLGKASPWGSQ